MAAGATDFHSRVDAIFGTLQQSDHSSPSSWTISDEQVCRTGKGDDYSSDEERDAKERESQLPIALHLEEERAQEGDQELPSNAFCRALDNEDELDANDVIATGVLYPVKDPPLSRQMEVLDDNVFDRASRYSQARALLSDPGEDAAADDMEIDPPHPSSNAPAENKASSKQASVDGENQAGGRNKGRKKRVRFAEPSPDVQETDGRQDSGSGVTQAAIPRPHQRNPIPGRKPSYVPDHVRNPGKYTVYELEEPLTVGGGHRSDTRDQADNVQAAMQAQADSGDATQHEEAVALPSFGAGIAFNPDRRKASGTPLAKQNKNADRANSTLMVENAVEDQSLAPQDTVVGSDDGSRAHATFQPKARRDRSLRGQKH